MDIISIFADGSCRKVNGELRAGVGVYSPHWNHVRMAGCVEAEVVTNNIAELCALGVTAHWILTDKRFRELLRGTQIVIYTDSKYSVDCLAKWYKHWNQKGWIKSDGCDVKNAGLIIAVSALFYSCREDLGLDVNLCWVKGHTSVPGSKLGSGNNEADALATVGLTVGPKDVISRQVADVLSLGAECNPLRPRRKSTTPRSS